MLGEGGNHSNCGQKERIKEQWYMVDGMTSVLRSGAGQELGMRNGEGKGISVDMKKKQREWIYEAWTCVLKKNRTKRGRKAGGAAGGSSRK